MLPSVIVSVLLRELNVGLEMGKECFQKALELFSPVERILLDEIEGYLESVFGYFVEGAFEDLFGGSAAG